MKVKGTAIIPLNTFVKVKFGDEKHKKWLDAIDDKGKKVFNQIILPTDWYDAEDALFAPIRKLAELYYNRDIKQCAWQTGEFSAEYGLKGIYKIFIKIGSAAFLIKKASTILPTYYKPSKMEVLDLQEYSTKIKMFDLSIKDAIIEYRVAGWMKKALEISGCQNIKIEMTKSIVTSDSSEFLVTWQ